MLSRYFASICLFGGSFILALTESTESFISLWELCGLESPQNSGERSLYRSAVVDGYKLTNFGTAVLSNIVRFGAVEHRFWRRFGKLFFDHVG